MGLLDFLFPKTVEVEEKPLVDTGVSSVEPHFLEKKKARAMQATPPSGGTSGSNKQTISSAVMTQQILNQMYQKAMSTPSPTITTIGYRAGQDVLRLSTTHKDKFMMFSRVNAILDENNDNVSNIVHIKDNGAKDIFALTYFIYLKGFEPVGTFHTVRNFDVFVQMKNFFSSFERQNNVTNDPTWAQFKDTLQRVPFDTNSTKYFHVADFVALFSFRSPTGKQKDFYFQESPL